MRLFLLLLIGLYQTSSFAQTDDKPLTFVKEMPYFEECKTGSNVERDACTRKKFGTYISKNFVYPEEARKKNIQGIVYVQFVITTGGQVKNVKAVRGVHPLIDNAAIKAVQSIPDLNPGKQLGKPVALLYTVPVKVLLNESPAEKRKAKREKRKG